MGEAVGVQLEEFAHVSYAPLAEALRQIAPRERRHAELGREGLRKIAATEPRPRRARGPGLLAAARRRKLWRRGSARFETLQRMGLRRRRNENLLAEWRAHIDATSASCNF